MKIGDILAEELVLPALNGTDEGGRARASSPASSRGTIPRSSAGGWCRRWRTASGSTAPRSARASRFPHGKLPGVKRVVAAFGRSRRGVDFQSLDGKPTHLFFLLVAPEDSAGAHLKALARISRLLKDESFRDRLLAGGDAHDLFDDDPARGRALLMVTVRELLETAGPTLGLRLVAGARGLDRTIAQPRLQQPGLALAGFLPQLHPDRVQVLGNSEIGYLAHAAASAAARRACRPVARAGVACFVVTNGTRPPAVLARGGRSACACRSSPSTLRTADFIRAAIDVARGAPRARDPGSRRPGRGPRRSASSFAGRAASARARRRSTWSSRGHRLVADDVVLVRRISPTVLRGRAAELLRAPHGDPRPRRHRRRGALRHARDARRAADRPRRGARRVDATTVDRLGLDETQIHRSSTSPLPLIRIPVSPGPERRAAHRDGGAQPPAARGAAATARASSRRAIERATPPAQGPLQDVEVAMSERLRAVVVTGLSGSGKSTALHVLEDLGFYCIDNLPVALLPRFIELWQSAREDVRRVALGHRRRASGGSSRDFPRVFDELRAAGDRARDPLPRGQRRRAGAAVQRDPPPASRGRGRLGRRRHPPRARGAARAARARGRASSTPARSPCTSCATTLRDLLATPDGGRDDGLAGVVRLQVRPADRRRPRARLPLPAEPVLRRGAAAQDRDRSGGGGVRARARRHAGVPRARARRCSPSRCRATSARARATSRSRVGCTGGRHRSVVLVEELRRRLAALGHRVLVRHRDVER